MAISSTVHLRSWLRGSCGGFTTDANRRMLDTRLAVLASEVLSTARAHRDDHDAIATTVLDACQALNDGRTWHRDLRLRSYVDVGIEVKAAFAFAELLASPTFLDPPIAPEALGSMLVEQAPDSRVAHLFMGELLAEAGDLDGALDRAECALRMQAVCFTAHDLYLRVQRARSDAGADVPALVTIDLTDRFCGAPFDFLSTGWAGEAYVCSCIAWVPFSIGNVHEAADADEVWNSPVAQEIRRSILDGDYTYCSRTSCSFITGDVLPLRDAVTNARHRRFIDEHTTIVDRAPTVVELNHDPTCNLACPSCRTTIMTASSDERERYDRTAERVLLPLLRDVEGIAYISGGGELFASPHYRSIVRALNRDEFPGLRLDIVTNGQLVTARWDEFPDLPPMIEALSVSVDAATAETYERLRPPGRWAPLLAALELLGERRRRDEFGALRLNFVVQRDNFREIPAFVELARSCAADTLWLQRMTNYGTFDEATYAALDVANGDHPDHQELVAILCDESLDGPEINMDMLLSALPEEVRMRRAAVRTGELQVGPSLAGHRTT